MGAMIKDVIKNLNNFPSQTHRRESVPNAPDRDEVRLAPGIHAFKERRRRRRVPTQPMYSAASVRILSRRDTPLDGHLLNLSETGLVVQLDEMIPVGQALTIEFSMAGLGQLRHDEWPTFAVAAEVVRIDDLSDFPNGPYPTAVRFVRIPTMVQAQIARYILTQPEIQTA